jgi:hypothetical protein
MSEATEQALNTKLDRIGKILPWMRILVVGAFAIGGWAATLEWRVQNHEGVSRAIEAEMKELGRAAVGTYPRESGHALDTRIARLEAQNEAIRDSLLRIEKSLNTR